MWNRLRKFIVPLSFILVLTALLLVSGQDSVAYAAGKDRIYYFNMQDGDLEGNMILVESDGHWGLLDAGHRKAGTIQDENAEEIRHAHAKGGKGKACHILVGPEGNGQEAVDKPARHGGDNGAEKRQQYTDPAFGVRSGLFVIVRAGKARKTAQIHNARDPQVQVSGFFGDDLSHGAEHDDGAEGNGPHDPCDQIAVHSNPSPA